MQNKHDKKEKTNKIGRIACGGRIKRIRKRILFLNLADLAAEGDPAYLVLFYPVRSCLSCLFFSLCILLMCSCQNSTVAPVSTVLKGNVMTIDYKIIIGSPVDEMQKKTIEELVSATFSEINTIYNKWNPHSEISTLNQLKGKVTYPISQKLESFLKFTDQIVKMTEGRFDPTIEPIQKLWKEKLANGEIPTNKEIAKIAPAVGWDKIHVENGYFYKDHDHTAIDLGGIAKGFCVDLLVENLNAAGYPHVYVEWGGEIRCSGKHPSGRPWRVFISNLGDQQQENGIAEIDLIDQAIATSGDYLQNWKIGTATYFHIFDATTKRPLVSAPHSIASASVVAPTCALADGLATAAMTFSTVEEAQQWSEQINKLFPETHFWFIENAREKSEEKSEI